MSSRNRKGGATLLLVGLIVAVGAAYLFRKPITQAFGLSLASVSPSTMAQGSNAKFTVYGLDPSAAVTITTTDNNNTVLSFGGGNTDKNGFVTGTALFGSNIVKGPVSVAFSTPGGKQATTQVTLT